MAKARPTVFGPVPSRRLGRSLGVCTIPPKYCTYGCRYCQVGRTTHHIAEPRVFYTAEEILAAVQPRVQVLRARGEHVDYISLVPDGEPTLDANLARSIASLRSLGIPIGVITNGSLLYRPDVRAGLALADWVSVKVDAARESAWRSLNRPHRSLKLDKVLEGLLTFRFSYTGRLVSESMMVAGQNDSTEDAAALAEYIQRLKPEIAYLAVPTRPPAESGLLPASEASVARLHGLLEERGQAVELLTGSEGDAFSSTGDVAADLLSITSVHPMRLEAVEALLKRAGSDWTAVLDLLADGRLVETAFAGQIYLVRGFVQRSRS